MTSPCFWFCFYHVLNLSFSVTQHPGTHLARRVSLVFQVGLLLPQRTKLQVPIGPGQEGESSRVDSQHLVQLWRFCHNYTPSQGFPL